MHDSKLTATSMNLFWSMRLINLLMSYELQQGYSCACAWLKRMTNMQRVVSSFISFFLILSMFVVLDLVFKVSGNAEGVLTWCFNLLFLFYFIFLFVFFFELLTFSCSVSGSYVWISDKTEGVSNRLLCWRLGIASFWNINSPCYIPLSVIFC